MVVINEILATIVLTAAETQSKECETQYKFRNIIFCFRGNEISLPLPSYDSRITYQTISTGDLGLGGYFFL